MASGKRRLGFLEVFGSKGVDQTPVVTGKALNRLNGLFFKSGTFIWEGECKHMGIQECVEERVRLSRIKIQCIHHTILMCACGYVCVCTHTCTCVQTWKNVCIYPVLTF